MTEHVFITLISGLWLAGYKMLHSPALTLSLVSLHKSEALSIALTSSSSYSTSWLGFVCFTCVYYVDSRFCNSQLIPEAPLSCRFTKTFCSLIAKIYKAAEQKLHIANSIIVRQMRLPVMVRLNRF